MHRVLRASDSVDGAGAQWLTKGDNNDYDDRVFYGGRARLDRKHIVGRVYARVAYLGALSVWVAEYRMVWYALAFVVVVGFARGMADRGEEEED